MADGRATQPKRSEAMTTETVERPEGLEDEHLEYLDELRESGVTNMFGAAPYLARWFALDIETARKYLSYWMKTFGQRHSA